MGAPYALSSDLVSAWPAKSLEVAQYIDGQVPLLAMTQNPQTGTTYSFVATDFTKLVTLSNASPVAVTLPLESSVPWPTGTQLRLLNQGAGTVTVAGAVGVTINGSPLTLTQYKGANLIKTGTNTWTFVPFASGVGAAVYSDANTGTYTGYAYKTFSASGTLTVTTAGFADIVVIGGGGGGGCFNGNTVGGGGGAGGALVATSVYLPVGTLTVTVAAGGAGGTAGRTGNAGNTSRLSDFYSSGGGSGAGPSWLGAATGGGGNGSSGGGGWTTGGTGSNGGSGIAGLGNNGGNGATSACGGGGGAAAVGSNAASGVGGAGGAGTTTAIAGTTPTGSYVAGTYAFAGGGGGAGAPTNGAGGSGGGGTAASAGGNGTANTGGGGGGGDTSGGNGGSGLVIVRVAV